MVEVRTTETEAALIDGLSDGIPLRQLCRTHGIGKSTVYRWMEDDEEFAGRIAGARARGFDALAEEALEIADDGSNDYVKRAKGEATEDVFDAEHVQRSRLRVDTRLKLLAKWDPKRYGDLVKLSGADGTSPALTALQVAFVKPGEESPE